MNLKIKYLLYMLVWSIIQTSDDNCTNVLKLKRISLKKEENEQVSKSL